MTCVRAAIRILLVPVACTPFFSCGGGQASPPAPAKNIQPIAVSGGPDNNYANGLFTSVTVCAPGTSNCQSVPNVLVDTGSYGLRIVGSVLGAVSGSLPQPNSPAGDPVFECAQFADSAVWGPVKSADVSIGNETAKSVPIQVIDAGTTPVPSACKALGPTEEDVSALGANGILGIGFFMADCGNACTAASASNPGFYYGCAASSCSVIAESLANQVQNPVALLPTNSNGYVINLPASSGSGPSLGGSLILGIGTSSDNHLGSASVFAPDKFGNMLTTFKGQQYSGYLDTGSNAYFFLDSKTTGIAACSNSQQGFYCPSSPVSLSATNSSSVSGQTSKITFTIVSANQLFSNSNDFVFPSLGGPNPSAFDWGLPFFFGRRVFVAIEGRSTEAGSGPYWAY
jgi:uncharacterized protein DUF3443